MKAKNGQPGMCDVMRRAAAAVWGEGVSLSEESSGTFTTRGYYIFSTLCLVASQPSGFPALLVFQRMTTKKTCE